MSDSFLPQLDGIDLDTALAEADTLLKQYGLSTPKPKIQDGDTIDNQRLAGYDTPESIIADNDKAQRIEDEYGIPLAQQKAMGLQGKKHLEQLLQNNPDLGQFDYRGLGAYGREIVGNDQLTDAMISDGYAVPTDRYDEKRQALYRAAMDKEKALYGTNREEMEALREYNIEGQAPSLTYRAGELVDLLQSRTTNLVGEVLDMAGDAIGAGLEKLGASKETADKFRHTQFERWADPEWSDKYFGFDNRELKFQNAEIAHAVKNGEYGKALGHAITMAPEYIVESLPTMLSLMVGAGETKIGTSVAKAAMKEAEKKGLKGAAQKAFVNDAVANIGVMQKATNLAKRNAGLLTISASETNKNIDAFKANNDGEAPSTAEIARMYGINVLQLGLDRWAFKDILKSPKALKDMKSLAQSLPKGALGDVTRTAIGTAKSMGEEAGQEYLQQWAQIVNENWGTKEQKTLTDVFTSEHNEEALTALIIGAGTGGAMHLGSAALSSGAKATAKKVDQEWARVNENIQAENDLAAQAPASDKPIGDRIEDFIRNLETPTAYKDEQSVKEHHTQVGNELFSMLDQIDADTTLKKEEADTYYGRLNDAYQKFIQRVAPEPTEIQAATEGNAKAIDRVLGSMRVAMDIPTNTAETLLKSDKLDDAQKATVKNYITRKRLFDEAKDMGVVSEEVLNGITPKFRGLNVYMGKIQNALQYADGLESVAPLLNDFQSFIKQRANKAKRLQSALDQAIQENRTLENPIIVKQPGHTDLKIHKGSGKLVQQAIFEAKYARQVGQEIQRMVEEKRSVSETPVHKTQPTLSEANETQTSQAKTLDETANGSPASEPASVSEGETEAVEVVKAKPQEKSPEVTPPGQKVQSTNEKVPDQTAEDYFGSDEPTKPSVSKSSLNALEEPSVQKVLWAYKDVPDVEIDLNNPVSVSDMALHAKDIIQHNPRTKDTDTAIQKALDLSDTVMTDPSIDNLISLVQAERDLRKASVQTESSKRAMKVIREISRQAYKTATHELDLMGMLNNAKDTTTDKQYQRMEKVVNGVLRRKKFGEDFIISDKELEVLRPLFENDGTKTSKDSLGHKILSKAVTTGTGLNINQWFEYKESTHSIFDEYNNLLSDGKALKQLINQYKDQPDIQHTLKSVAKHFRIFKEKFTTYGPAVLNPQSFLGKRYLVTPERIKALKWTTDPKYVEKSLLKTPFQLLAYFDGKHTKFDDNLIGVMMLNAYIWLGQNGQATLMKSKEEINKFLGRDNDHEVSNEEWDLLATIGDYRNMVIDSLGQSIYKQLGIKLKEGEDANLERRLINDLGAQALRMLEVMGLIEENEISVEEITKLKGAKADQAFSTDDGMDIKASDGTKGKMVKFIRAVPSKEIDTQKLRLQPRKDVLRYINFYKENATLLSHVFGSANFRTGPFNQPVKEVDTKVQRSTLSIPEENRKAMEKQQRVAWKVWDHKIAVLKRLGKDGAREIMGYKSDLTAIHAARRASVEGRNQAIDKEYDDLMEFLDSDTSKKPFYFKYVFWKNGRYGIDSNTLNPQSKKMHRHMIGITSHEVSISFGSKEEEQFKLAVAQAFDGKVDKKRKAKSLAFFDELVDDPVIFEALAALNDPEADTDAIIEAVKKGGEEWHTLDGLIALDDYLKAKAAGTKEFTTTLGMETDAVTSGFILTLMQIPLIKNTMEWLEKGGVFKRNDVSDYGEYAENHTDSYQTLALRVYEKLSPRMNEGRTKTLVDLVGDLVKEGKVTKFGRDFMKPPFMTFIYGSGMDNILRGVCNTVLDVIYKELESLVNAGDIDGLKDMQEKLRAIGIKHDVVKNPMHEWSKRDVQVLHKLVEETYGASIKDALEDEFEEIVEYRKQTNKMFQLMFNAFDIRFKKELAKAKKAKGSALTKEEVDVIVTKLHKFFPGIKPYFNKDGNPNEKISVIGRKKEFTNAPDRTTQSEFTREVVVHGKRLGESMTSHAYNYVYEAAGAAGAVVTIHYIDGAIITSPLMKYNSLGVHDAVLHSLKDVVEGTREYNRSTLQVSSQYSIASHLAKEMIGIYKALTKEEQKELNELQPVNKKGEQKDVVTQIKEYRDLTQKIHEARKSLFSGSIRIGHASHPDTMVEYNFATGKFNNVVPEKPKEPKLDYSKLKKRAREFMEKMDKNQLPRTAKRMQKRKEILDELTGKSNTFKYRKKGNTRAQQIKDATIPTIGGSEEDAKARVKAAFKKSYESQVRQAWENVPDEEVPFDEITRDVDWDAVQAELIAKGSVDDLIYKSNGETLDLAGFKAKFENEVAADNVLSIFEEIKQYDNVKVAPEQESHYKEILSSLVQKAFGPAGKAMVKFSTDQKVNAGASVKDEVFINVTDTKPQTAIAQSAQEIYTHELLHHVLKFGIDKGQFAYRQELKRLYQHAKAHTSYKDFLKRNAKGEIVYVVDEAKEIEQAKATWDYIFKNPEGNNLHEFAVYGLSNPQLMQKLQQLDVVGTRDTKSGTLLQRLKNWLLNFLDRLVTKLDKVEGTNAYEALYDLTSKLAGINNKRVSLFRQRMDMAYDAVEKFNQLIRNQLDKGTDKFFTYVSKNPTNVVTKSWKAIRGLPLIVANPKVVQGIRSVAYRMGFREDSTIYQIFREIKGDRKEHGDWYALLRQSKKLIDQAREAEATVISSSINDAFKTDISDMERVAINAAMIETDLSVLMDDYTTEEIRQLLVSDTMLDTEIEMLENSMVAKLTHHNYYTTYAKALGKYMALNVTSVENLPLNAYAIAQMHGTGFKPVDDVNQVEKMVDKLATLYALQYTPKDARYVAGRVMEREYKADPLENGIRFTLATHKHFKEMSLEKLFGGNKTQMIKGYTKEIYDRDIFVETAPMEKMDEMLRRGFKLVKQLPKHRWDESHVPMGLFKSEAGMVTPWLKSIVSTTERHVKGTTLTDIYTTGDQGAIGKYFARINIDKVKKINETITRRIVKGAKPSMNDDKLLPVWDEYGNIVDYRYTMSKFVKTNSMDKENRFDVILGRMYGSVIDRIESQKMNTTVINKLYEDYKENYKKDPKAFVKISKTSEKRYQELYAVLPEHMKYEMAQLWGKREIYVRRELADLIFGYRKWAFASTKLFNNKHAMKRVVQLVGKLWTEVVSIAKVNMVIRTPHVLIDNIISNVITTLFHGVPLGYSISKQIEAMRALKEYKELDRKRKELLHRKESGVRYDASLLAQYEHDLKNNPVKDLIDEGLFQSIVEDVDTKNFEYKTKLGKQIDKMADKLLPDMAIKVGKQLYMTQDTQTFQFLLKATQYSDFVARYAQYHYMVDHKGMSKKDAIDQVIESYIDYDVPTNKYLQWMNDMGLVMFTKYLLRIQRVILRTAKENPGRLSISVLLQSWFGDISDIADSQLALETNPLDRLTVNPLALVQKFGEDLLTPSAYEIGRDTIKWMVK